MFRPYTILKSYMKNSSITDKRLSGVTLRAMIVAMLIMPLNAYWIIQMEVVWWGFPTIITLFYNVIFILLILYCINLILKKYIPKWTFSQGELMTVYVMLSIATALSGYDMMQCLVSLIGTPTWYATPENEWNELFGQHLPNWLVIKDKKVLEGYFNGETSLYSVEYLKGWMMPIISWVGFVVVLIFTMLCISIIVRKQWIDNEKLAYPIIRLPYETTKSDTVISFFKRRSLWIGFALAGGIDLLNGLNYFYPAIPFIPVKPYIHGIYFTQKPWSAMGYIPISLYPFVIGLGFLMPLELAISTWFFYLFWKTQLVLGSVAGWQLAGYPYPTQQVGGTWIALLLFSLWIGRTYFINLIKRIFTKKTPQKDDRMYRMAFLGLFLGTLFLVLFAQKAGMSLLIAISFFVIYLALSTAITRIRAELGPPAHDMYGAGPDYILTTMFGTRRLGPNNLTAFSLFYWINREAYRTQPMPHILEGFKLAQLTGMNERRLSYAMILSAFVGGISCFWAFLHIGYNLGASTKLYGRTWFAREAFSRLQQWLSYPTDTDIMGLSFMGIGFIFTLGLLILRSRFLWWQLHPVGYAVSGWWIISILWFPILISSTIKYIILKYGGIRKYRQAIPFFIGLILGEYIIGSLWSLFGIIFSLPIYVFWY